jgi:hypothetical protein
MAAAAVASGEAPTTTAAPDTSKDPVWLYINHLGWCRWEHAACGAWRAACAHTHAYTCYCASLFDCSCGFIACRTWVRHSLLQAPRHRVGSPYACVTAC